MAVMAAETVMACSFTLNVSTPSARAASSFSLIATRYAPKRERSMARVPASTRPTSASAIQT